MDLIMNFIKNLLKDIDKIVVKEMAEHIADNINYENQIPFDDWIEPEQVEELIWDYIQKKAGEDIDC